MLAYLVARALRRARVDLDVTVEEELEQLKTLCSMEIHTNQGGTVLVKDIRISDSSSSPDELVDVNRTIFFSADDGVDGRELWNRPCTSAKTCWILYVINAIITCPDGAVVQKS